MILKRTAREIKYNTGYNSRLEPISSVYLTFKHFEFIKHCFMS